jgi:hypothetical protein
MKHCDTGTDHLGESKFVVHSANLKKMRILFYREIRLDGVKVGLNAFYQQKTELKTTK